MFFARKDPLKEARSATMTAIRKASEELRRRQPAEDWFGFALCTDDDLRTVYHIACTRSWVREKEETYPGIGFIYVEWQDSADDGLFQPLSTQFAALADKSYRSETEWAEARDRRFEVLALALKDCREERLFTKDTLLCVGSTDPSEHLESLAMHAVDEINSPPIADQFAKHLGYEKHRTKV